MQDGQGADNATDQMEVEHPEQKLEGPESTDDIMTTVYTTLLAGHPPNAHIWPLSQAVLAFGGLWTDPQWPQAGRFIFQWLSPVVTTWMCICWIMRGVFLPIYRE